MGNHHQLKNLSEEQKKKLEEGKPVLLPGGIRIKKNQKTQQFQGIPQQWVESYDLPIKIDYSKTIKTNKFSEEIRPQYDLPDSIIDLVNSQPVNLQFSQPSNFSHNIHLEIDINSPFGIKNLPEEWIKKFEGSKISAEDIKSDPKSVIKMISSYEAQIKQSVVETQLLTSEDFQEMVSRIQFIEENPANEFIFDKQLGKGAMCKVFYAYDRNQKDRKDYACRIIKLKDKKTLQKIKNQIAVMGLCNSQAIVNYHFTYYYKQSLFMFIDFMDVGALTDFVYNYLKKIPEEVIAYIMKQSLIGLKALHMRKQIHRDLKSDNILIDTKGNVKIADFGFAIQLTKDRMKRKSVVGTPAWMAPQLIRKEEYDEKVDIWSIGMVTIQLCEGQPPYLRMPHLKAMHNIVSKPAPQIKGFSESLCHFVSGCLQKNPKDRMSCDQLLQHSFMKKAVNGKEAMIEMIKKMKNDFPF